MSLLLGSLRAQERGYSYHIGKCDESGYCIVLRRESIIPSTRMLMLSSTMNVVQSLFQGEEIGTLAYPKLERFHSARVCSLRTSSKT
jgi:hypothetical protein